MTKAVKITLGLFVLFFSIAFICFRPIINPKLSDCDQLTGRLDRFTIMPDTKDIHFFLDNSDKFFYINRGLESGLNKEILESMVGKAVTVYPINHWTLLDPNRTNPHVARLELGDEVLYSEF